VQPIHAQTTTIQRQFFVREFAEALSASVAEGNPEAIKAYLTRLTA
jgi:hypothetical protein